MIEIKIQYNTDSKDPELRIVSNDLPLSYSVSASGVIDFQCFWTNKTDKKKYKSLLSACYKISELANEIYKIHNIKCQPQYSIYSLMLL
jgi:hypothetical protein